MVILKTDQFDWNWLTMKLVMGVGVIYCPKRESWIPLPFSADSTRQNSAVSTIAELVIIVLFCRLPNNICVTFAIISDLVWRKSGRLYLFDTRWIIFVLAQYMSDDQVIKVTSAV